MKFKDINFEKVNCFIYNPDPKKIKRMEIAVDSYNSGQKKIQIIGTSTSHEDAFNKIKKFETESNEVVLLLLHDINRYVNIDTIDFSDPKSIMDKGILGNLSKARIRVRLGNYFYDHDESEFLTLVYEYEENLSFLPGAYLSDGFKFADLKKLYEGLAEDVKDGNLETNKAKDLFVRLPEYNSKIDNLNNEWK